MDTPVWLVLIHQAIGWMLAGYLPNISLYSPLCGKYIGHLPESQNSRFMEILDGFARLLPTIAVASGSIVAISVVITDYQAQAGWLAGGALLTAMLFLARQFANIQTYSFRNRLAWSFVLLASLTLLITLTSSFINLRQQSRTLYQQRLLDMVSLAALQQDGDAFLTISSENDAEFERVRVQNLAIKRSQSGYRFCLHDAVR